MANLKNLRLIPANQLFCLILTWFGLAGLIIYIVGLYGWLNQVNIVIICLLLLVLLCPYVCNLIPLFFNFTAAQKLLVFLLLCQLALYSLGLFVPETGFDALWYHLPEALHYARSGSVTAIPGLTYSTMPRLGEMYYAAAFFTQSLVIVKLVAFLFTGFWCLVTYFLSRFFLSRTHSLLVALTVNSLYLVSWAASSAYVDLPRAVFELGSLLCLFVVFFCKPISRLADYLFPWLSLSAILLGFALSVKIQAFIGLFAITAFLVLSFWHLRLSVIKIWLLVTGFWLLTAFTAAPWYLDNYLQSGHPFYPANTPEIRQNILSHVGAATEIEWLIRKFTHLPFIFWDLGTLPVYQLTPIIAILFPVLLLRFSALRKNIIFCSLLIALSVYLFLWWFLPPAESRYLLPVLPPLIILLFYSVFSLSNKYSSIKQIALIFIFISLALNFLIRAAASRKYLPVILGHQSTQEYVTSQTTDFNHSIISKFYSSLYTYK